jgi:hypothetical protein
MPSIYLAKSNSCSLSTVTAIRDYLSTLPHVVLKEFKGGTYSNADLLSSDYLMIIPQQAKENPFLGKGLWSQVEDWKKAGKPLSNVLVFTEMHEDNTLFRHKVQNFSKIAPLHFTEINDRNDWKLKYARAWTKNESQMYLYQYNLSPKRETSTKLVKVYGKLTGDRLREGSSFLTSIEGASIQFAHYASDGFPVFSIGGFTGDGDSINAHATSVLWSTEIKDVLFEGSGRPAIEVLERICTHTVLPSMESISSTQKSRMSNEGRYTAPEAQKQEDAGLLLLL